jgi:hypothetical protein
VLEHEVRLAVGSTLYDQLNDYHDATLGSQSRVMVVIMTLGGAGRSVVSQLET